MDFGSAAAQLAGAAAQLLGWRPDEFWSATPAELATALMPPGGDERRPDKAAIAALIAQFPD